VVVAAATLKRKFQRALLRKVWQMLMMMMMQMLRKRLRMAVQVLIGQPLLLLLLKQLLLRS
jgi:hypothetical protein